MKSKFYPTKPKGLGDVVYHYAQPAAAVIDKAMAILGVKTNLANCRGCHGRGGRRERWNKALPL